MGKRAAKIPDSELIPFVRETAAAGEWLEYYHQRIENVGRLGHDVTRQEIAEILLDGWREPARDRFEPYHTWSYAMRGRTIDGREIRIAFSVDQGRLFIVSVYALEKGGKE